MSKKGPRRGGDFTVIAPVTGSAIANNSTMKNVTITPPGEASSTSLDDLREAIASLREEIGVAGGSEAADDRIRYELQTIEEELDEDEPDGAVVHSRWKQVQKLLGPLQGVAGIAQSTQQILTLIRTLFGGN